MTRYPTFDLSQIELENLSERQNQVGLSDCPRPGETTAEYDHPEFGDLCRAIVTARRNDRPVILMIGAHVVKQGMSRFVIDLMQRGWVTHVATNGAGIIHDFEMARIGGTSEAVEATTAAATEAGASRVVPLKVAGAFHTPLMATAAEGMAKVLEGAPFSDPGTPVISNVTGQPLTMADALASELRDQITSPVLWVDSLRTMLGAGVSSFVEFGPGRVLTGTVGRTDRSASVRNVASAADARGEGGE